MALEARFVRQEWAQRLAADPTGERRALVLVRVEPCEPEGLLGPVVYIDLVGLDEASARQQLREELAAVVRGERRLLADPSFPGGRSAPVARGMRGPRFPTALPPTWNVPFRRNPDFTGREEALDDLANQLGQNAATAVTQALQGGGGVGKTALAVEYAYRYRSRFETVWWVRAEEPTTVVGDYANLAAALKLPEADGADQQQAAKVVHAWLDENDRWLLILDNAQGPDTPTGLPAPLARLVDLIPQVLHGQALVTSRDASWEEYGALAELEVYSFEEAVAFLLARTGSNDQAAATEISELLGLLPLALEQAGAYVRETRLSLSAYLDRLRHYPALTITRGRPRDRDPADTVATTWELSLERVRSTPGAVALLEVCAFLDPEEIPRELLSRQLDPPAEELAPLADPFTLDKAVAAVRRFGLVKASEETLSVHRLLQQVIRDQLDPAARTARAATAVRLLAVALPFTDYADPRQWPAAARLVPHGLAAADNANQLKVEPMLTASLLGSAADYLQSRARHGEARSLRERSLTIFEAHLGPDHPDTLTARHTLASARGRAGDAAGAVTALKELVQDYERIFGPDHPRTLAARHGLARWQRRAGDAAGAVAALRELVQDYERVFGPDHHDTLAARDNLARSQDRFTKPDSR